MQAKSSEPVSLTGSRRFVFSSCGSGTGGVKWAMTFKVVQKKNALEMFYFSEHIGTG